MNFKVRLRNPIFWMTIIPAVAALIYIVLGFLEVVPPIAQDDLLQGASLLVSALTTLGVLVDPTTAGLKDSHRALTYETPKDSDMMQ